MKWTVIASSVLMVAACSNAATLEPTATVPRPTATSQPTPVPPTATATHSEPVELPPTPTPLPTANFAPSDIVAIWTRSDPERGNLFLIFNADGSYTASHGTPEGIVHTGLYKLDGRLFTWVAKDGWSLCTENDATYMLRYAGGGQYLVFEPLADDCPDRADAFRGFRWDRYVQP